MARRLHELDLVFEVRLADAFGPLGGLELVVIVHVLLFKSGIVVLFVGLAGFFGAGLLQRLGILPRGLGLADREGHVLLAGLFVTVIALGLLCQPALLLQFSLLHGVAGPLRRRDFLAVMFLQRRLFAGNSRACRRRRAGRPSGRPPESVPRGGRGRGPSAGWPLSRRRPHFPC